MGVAARGGEELALSCEGTSGTCSEGKEGGHFAWDLHGTLGLRRPGLSSQCFGEAGTPESLCLFLPFSFTKCLILTQPWEMRVPASFVVLETEAQGARGGAATCQGLSAGR